MVSRLNLLLENIIPFLFCSILSCHCLVATDEQDAENCHKETPSRRNLFPACRVSRGLVEVGSVIMYTVAVRSCGST